MFRVYESCHVQIFFGFFARGCKVFFSRLAGHSAAELGYLKFRMFSFKEMLLDIGAVTLVCAMRSSYISIYGGVLSFTEVNVWSTRCRQSRNIICQNGMLSILSCKFGHCCQCVHASSVVLDVWAL